MSLGLELGDRQTGGNEPTIQVAYRPELIVGDDFGIFLRPSGLTRDGRILQAAEISYSWRRGTDYLVFDQPIRAYHHELVQLDWTAVVIPWPNLSGLLTFELYLDDGSQGSRLVASGDVLVGHYARLKTNQWVCGWSPISAHSHPDAELPAKSLPELDLAFEPLSIKLEDHTLLAILTIGTDTIAPPEYVAFDRFPYDFGAVRNCCSIPHGPQPKSSFLVPISRRWERGPIQIQMGTMGGYAQSKLNLIPWGSASSAGSAE